METFVNVYVGDELVSMLKLNPDSPFTPAVKSMAEAPERSMIIDVTGLPMLPGPDSVWNGEAFSAPLFPNTSAVPVVSFAFVLDSVCIYRHDVMIEHQPHLIAAYRTGVRFEVFNG